MLEEGSPNSHLAIVARALDIPVVGQVREAMSRIEHGDRLIVDAEHAQVLVRPSEDVRTLFIKSLEARDQRRAAYAALKDLPAVTLDGVQISVNINAGLLIDLQHLAETDIDGVGLYRTEVPFMVRPELPDVEAQRQIYHKVLEYAGSKPVVFRTLDVGGDKVMPYWPSGQEENPAMGWRAIRVSFDRPAMLRQQLRALIMAAAERDLWLMFPMLTEVSEFRYGRSLLDMELARVRARGGPVPRRVQVGAMLEVPALIYQLPELLSLVDFISIGTNDLFQFMFASDRGNYQMSERYDSLSPVALSTLRLILQQCQAARVPVSVCGEMAARPLDAMALLGHRLSHHLHVTAGGRADQGDDPGPAPGGAGKLRGLALRRPAAQRPPAAQGLCHRSRRHALALILFASSSLQRHCQLASGSTMVRREKPDCTR